VPDSRSKYLYERLGDNDFQLLVNALLTERFPDYVPLPLGQSDGGRDGVRRSGKGLLVYQVKWSAAGREKSPVAWLDAAVRKEDANIRRQVAAGAKKYLLVTNVPSTGSPVKGTFDKLDSALAVHAKTYGIPMDGVWREAVDAMVDSAPDATKWSYADMLAGWDLVRYLVDEHARSGRDRGLRDLVRKVAATQWDEDDRVKFSQVDLDREHVADLFVDVNAARLSAPPAAGTAAAAPAVPVGGAAAYLLRTRLPFTLVRGAPGQGKSTLTQFVCQAHRAAFVPHETASPRLPAVAEPRFPIRLDLGAYAAWLQGADVFAAADEARPAAKPRKRPAGRASLDCFIADLLVHAGGGADVSPADVQAIFERVPSLVVLDGLDEVGSQPARRTVVDAIRQFCVRARTYTVPPKVVVTTRPSAGQLVEPATDLFEVLSLAPLDPRQRDEYLRRWCAVRGVRGAAGRALRAGFKARSAEPYIDELAGNPMQLTILLELLHQQGAATPTQRTELYDMYMQLVLAREANKHPDSVRKHRNDLMEIVPFLGWYLQSRSEDRGLGGRMRTDALAAAMRHFQRTYGKPESVVDELFEAATDRLWALTSKEQGAFEFEVVSLREYFAAQYLYRYAGEGDPQFDRTVVFRELLRRAYWLNTARFYSGNARGADLYVLAAGIRQELAAGGPRQARIASWTLLTDGVFLSRPDEAASVVDAACDPAGIPVLLDALDRAEIRPLPAGPGGGPGPTWARLTTQIAAAPDAPDSATAARALQELLPLRADLGRWWAGHAAAAVGTSAERPWLVLGGRVEAAAGVPLDLHGADLSDGGAQRVLDSGAVPPPGGPLERDLVAAVLDGQCPATTSTRSLPAQIAVALAPSGFLAGPTGAFPGPDTPAGRRRHDAVGALRRAGSPYARIAAARRYRAGEKGSTFPWANTAAALHQHAGPCWLAFEIALVGAASPQLDGYTVKPLADAFGPNGHPAALIAQTRANAADPAWWTAQRRLAGTDLEDAVWLLAVWAVAAPRTIAELFRDWEDGVDRLAAARYRPLAAAARLLGRSGHMADRPVTATPQTHRGAELLAGRTPPAAPAPPPTPTAPVVLPGGPEQSLESVAKAEGWLKVDVVPSYL
jgi:hypothetical protein